MEIILAIVVASAVIFFGALISMGNERQRKAIDGMREQVALWAVQDLLIKREQLGRDVSVANPLKWFNNLATKALGYDPKLQFLEALDEPRALMFISEDTSMKLVFSAASQKEINSLKASKRGRLSHFVEKNPLLTMPRNAKFHEFSALNCGMFFDLELSLAWKEISGQHPGEANSVWAYQIA
jgi:hypothetical protein